MAHFKNALILVALCFLANVLARNTLVEDSQVLNGLRNEEGDRSHDDSEIKRLCELGPNPIFNCYDCKTRLICYGGDGGVSVKCYNPFAPYCDNGRCSSNPSAACA